MPPQNIKIKYGLITKSSPPDGSDVMAGDVGLQVDDGREVLENFIFEHVYNVILEQTYFCL